MKFLLCNWVHISEQRGGCESVFSELDQLIRSMGHETKMVSFNSAKKIMGIGLEKSSMGFYEVEASHIIDMYCSNYQRLFPETAIISNAGITNFWYKNKNTINIFNDPYRPIVEKLLRTGLYGAPTYNKYGKIMVKMQQASAEGAKNVAISDFMANVMRGMGVEPDITIPHGIDLEKFKPMDKAELRQKHGIPDGMPVAVWSKDFHPVAGFHIISALVRKFPDVFWVLSFKHGNDGKTKAKNVKIMQTVERDEMANLYNIADFCINPSAVESFGLVPLEAMACGIPSIVSNTGFVWEPDMEEKMAKRDYGMLVNNWRAESYEEAVNDMLLDGKKFRPREFASQFSIEKWRISWKKLIEEACLKTI